MRVLLIESSLLGMGASGVNAGTLSFQIKRVGLMAYALKGHALWKKAGQAVGFRRIGGLTLAFNDREAEMLVERMTARRQAGAPIDLIKPSQAREREPGLTSKVVLASYCAEDGYANSRLTGTYYRGLLRTAGVDVLERSAVEHIDSDGSTVEIRTARETFRASR